MRTTQRSNRSTQRLSARAALFAGAITPAALLLLGGCTQTLEVTDTTPPLPSQITGRFIAVVCDADMGATAFVDGLLSRRSESDKDALTIVGLPLNAPGSDEQRAQTPYAQVEVSNSVMGPPRALTLNPSGTLAFVAETRGRAGAGALRVGDLPEGRVITPIDLRDPLNPKVLPAIDVGAAPVTVDINPAGDLLAVTLAKPGAQIALIAISTDTDGNWAFGEKLTFPLAGLDDSVASSAVWHPSGRYLGVTIPGQDLVAFYEFARDINGAPGLARWGEPLKVGTHPFHGVFTPDGKRFIATELHWGPQVEGYLVGAPDGSLSVIELSDVPSSVGESAAAAPATPESSSEGEPAVASAPAAPAVVHRVADQVQVGISPEGLAISPDGRWIVTSNLRRSMLPTSDKRFIDSGGNGSVNLLSLASDGKLTSHGEFALNAMPEGITFDAEGRHVIVTQFRSLDPQAVDGELAFFKLVTKGPEGSPTLIPSEYFVGVGVGPHGLVIVR
jgi:DNA-binding beta-propeller fold protein YncE